MKILLLIKKNKIYAKQICEIVKKNNINSKIIYVDKKKNSQNLLKIKIMII